MPFITNIIAMIKLLPLLKYKILSYVKYFSAILLPQLNYCHSRNYRNNAKCLALLKAGQEVL